jgi:hypothetical protein
MKKVMLVIVCLLFAATAFAQQSDPSNDVGYVKINSTGSGTPGVQAVVAFGLPFKFWNVVSNVPQFGNESTRPVLDHRYADCCRYVYVGRSYRSSRRWCDVLSFGAGRNVDGNSGKWRSDGSWSCILLPEQDGFEPFHRSGG